MSEDTAEPTKEPDDPKPRRRRKGRRSSKRRRASRHLATGYSGGLDGATRFEALGTLVLTDTQWRLRFWISGNRVHGSLLGADITAEPRPLRRSPRVHLRSADNTFGAEFKLPFVSAKRFERQHQRHRAAASDVAERHALIRAGHWWLHPDAFLDAGAARTISLTQTRYLGGWTGPVRHYRRPKLRILDVNKHGLTLRGFRRHLLIPWESISGLDITPDDTAKAVLLVGIDSGDTVRFEPIQLTIEELESKLAPITAQIGRVPELDSPTE